MMTEKCGPHCGINQTPTGQEKGHLVKSRHCDRCHEEYDFPMTQRPRH